MAQKQGSAHYHSCTKCKDTFLDACFTPEVDTECLSCRAGHEPPPWQVSGRPKDCCRLHSRPAFTKGGNQSEISIYKLAGGGVWHICTKCKRTFKYNPMREFN